MHRPGSIESIHDWTVNLQARTNTDSNHSCKTWPFFLVDRVYSSWCDYM